MKLPTRQFQFYTMAAGIVALVIYQLPEAIMGMILCVFVFLGLIALNVYSTVSIVRDEFSEQRQKILQICLVWLVPLFASLLVLAFHRQGGASSSPYRRQAGHTAGDGTGKTLRKH